MNDNRKERLIQTVKTVLTELGGIDLSGVDPKASFFELGFDSLLLTQAAGTLKNRLRIKISFRQLLEELTSIEAIAVYADQQLAPDAAPAEPAMAHPTSPAMPEFKAPSPNAAALVASAAPLETLSPVSCPASPSHSSASPGVAKTSLMERVMKDQLAVMAKQLEMLRQLTGRTSDSPGAPLANPVAAPKPNDVSSTTPAPESKAEVEPRSLGPYRPIKTGDISELSSPQQRALNDLIRRYTAKTPKSKQLTQASRAHFSDPRTVAGFRTFWKEMVYPIVTSRSAGVRFWDVDDNEYIDVTMGFGTNLLGHLPPFVESAIAEQLKKGIEVGPQSPLAGKVAQLMCELTGHERVAFCNTGSEAVLAAIRVARTVTGRTRIATFSGAYHGICDEVLVRGNVVGGKRVSVPIAPGVPNHAVREVLVLEYGTQESLDILEQNMDELALVLVEPVQSRHPELQPGEFLRQLRRITTAHETPLFFDEVITGFRCHLGGAQAYFGVKADLASWGKVIGGGLPVGALTGSAKYLDVLDGGFWQYGDNSFPETGITFFAGTYVRHPLALAASYAVLSYLKAQGPGLQEQLTAKTEKFVAELRAFLQERGVPLQVEQFASIFYIHFGPEIKHGSLLWFYLREKGIHFWENRPGFLSTAHTDADIACLLDAIKQSVVEMQAAGFLPPEPANEPAFRPKQDFPGSQGPASNGKLEPKLKTDGPARPPIGAGAQSQGAENGSLTSAFSGNRNPVDFSVYFFGNYEAEYHPDKYKVILEAAKFADQNGFKAIWIPERHFHPVGGFSPNPCIIAAALARETKHLHLRAGSVVLPLHHPVRVAEDWSVVDNLSDGRVGISIASGWHRNDFVFAPEAFDRRREICWEMSEVIQKLWRGEEIPFSTGGKSTLNVKIHPLPKQFRLPTWLTCIHKESYVKAGELGMGVLGYTMNTSLKDLAESIRCYREAFAKAGHDPRQANVTILLHTFVGADRSSALAIARQPFRNYLRSFLDNSRKRLDSQNGQTPVDQEDIEYLLDRAFDDYVNGKSLIGSPESCAGVVTELKKMGVDEVGCFLDFGVAPDLVLANLQHILKLKQLCQGSGAPATIPATEASSANGKPAANDSSTEEKRVIPIPESQKGMATIINMGADASRAYTQSNTLEIRGPLDIFALRRALQHCVDRHEALRVSMNPDGETQTIHRHVTLEVPFEDLSHLSTEEQASRQKLIFNGLEAQPLDLSAPPIVRAQIVKLEEGRHRLLLIFHHLVSNGPSYWILFEDLCAFYEAEKQGRPLIRPRPLQLSEFVDWRQRKDMKDSEAFWLRQFAEVPPDLELPLDHPRPPVITFRGSRGIRRLPATLVTALRKAAATQRCSLYMALAAGFEALLHRLSGQFDVVVGTMFDSEVRSLPGGDGLFANTTNVLPLRSRLTPQTTFAEMLATVKQQVLAYHEHQEYFFGTMLAKLKLPFDPGRRPLLSVLFNYETGTFKRQVAGVEVEYLTTSDVLYRGPWDTAMYELYLNIAEQGGELLCQCDYNSDLIDGTSLDRWLEQLEELLTAAAQNIAQPITQLPILGKLEQAAILTDWNRTENPFPRDLTVHAWFKDQAGKCPKKIAARCAGKTATYFELDAASDELAGRLQSAGVKRGDLVGICLDRSINMVTGLLGIMKTGAAYVPMDPDFPSDRLQLMIEDAQMSVMVTEPAISQRLHLAPVKALMIDDRTAMNSGQFVAASPAAADDLMYVIFTSGSTGRPKGVEISHRAVVNFLNSMSRAPGMNSEDVLLAVTTLSFDIAGLELFLPLVTGATLVVATREAIRDGNLLRSELEQNGISVMQATPITWQLLLEAGWQGNSTLKILCGGEALPVELANQLLPRGAELWNMYGPTETTIWSTCHRITQPHQPARIGRPIDNTQVYIVNEQLQLQPIGVVGELLIGGTGMAKGYHQKPALTAERFLADKFSGRSEAKLYRTGDLARWHPDGTIECLGRLDHQVKIRGFRIELGEIEEALNSHPVVRECVVIAREENSGQKRLIGYVSVKLGAKEAPTSAKLAELPSTLARHLQTKLPNYMVPPLILILDTLPRTPNGKIDRKALPAPDSPGETRERTFIAPRDEKERMLAEIWQQVLGLEKVSVQESFFELGGDSLSSFRVANRANQKGMPLNVRMFFEHRTIEKIVKAIENEKATPEKTAAIPAVTRVPREAHRRKLAVPIA